MCALLQFFVEYEDFEKLASLWNSKIVLQDCSNFTFWTKPQRNNPREKSFWVKLLRHYCKNKYQETTQIGPIKEWLNKLEYLN